MSDQQKIEMGGCESMEGDCMPQVRKRYSRARFSILPIVIGLLRFAQRGEWFL